MDLTASFLPKPVAGVNGNGMHTNMSIAKKGKNLFYDKKGQDGLSPFAWSFINRILANANDICLILNSSVNSYRRLDPHFEAPNQIKVSPSDRGSMIRIPIGNERSARIEVRSIAPDANPYLAIYSLFKTGLEGPASRTTTTASGRGRASCPTTSTTPSASSRAASTRQELLGEKVHEKYAELKLASAERCPKALGAPREALRDPVPPRGHEPVPLGPVLGGRRSGRGARIDRGVVGQWPATPFLRFPSVARGRAPSRDTENGVSGYGRELDKAVSLRRAESARRHLGDSSFLLYGWGLRFMT